MTPISSMCPSSMIVGDPCGLTTAMLFPATSELTSCANVFASSRQTLAGADSKPEGPGVSSRRFRKAIEESFSIAGGKCGSAGAPPGQGVGGHSLYGEQTRGNVPGSLSGRRPQDWRAVRLYETRGALLPFVDRLPADEGRDNAGAEHVLGSHRHDV